MKKYLYVLSLVLSSQVFAIGSSERRLPHSYNQKQADKANLVPNPLPVKNTDGWTCTNCTVAPDATNLFEKQPSFKISSATHPATLCTGDIEAPTPHSDGLNGEVFTYFKGDASKWRIEIKSSGGSSSLNSLDLANESAWRPAGFNFPLANNYRVCITSTASTPADINIGKVYWGEATNLSEVSQAKPIARLGRITSGQSVASTSETQVVFNGSTYIYSGSHNTTTGAFTVDEPGVYTLYFKASLSSYTANEMNAVRIRVNGTEVCQKAMSASGTDWSNDCSTQVPVVAGDVITASVRSASDSSYSVDNNSGSYYQYTYLDIAKLPDASQIAVQPANTADLLGSVFYTPTSACPAGSIKADGATISSTYPALAARLGASTVPDLQGIFIRGAGSQSVSGTSYSGTLGSTQGQATKLPSSSFTGSAASNGNHNHESGVTFNNSANGRSAYGQHGNSGVPDGPSYVSVVADGTVAAAGTDGSSARASGTSINGAHTHTVTINGGGDSETRPANISLTPCIWHVSSHAPLLVGSVTSNSAGLERIERANIDCDGASSITSQSGSWVSSVGNIATGQCTITMAAGIFSSAPLCTASRNDNFGILYVNASSATNLVIDCQDAAAVDCASWDANVICQGPR